MNRTIFSKTTGTQTTTYTYDYENRLTQITYPDNSTQTFTYCPLGKRMAKDNSIFLYDDQDLISEYDQEGTLNARYTFGPGIDNPISVRIGTQSYFYHLDGLGSVIAITDSNKNIVSSYSYDAFGFPLPSSISNLPSSLLFTSREYEPKSNLYYYRARYYDPSVGRFLSTDPILCPQSCPTCPGANVFPIKGAGLLRYPGMNEAMFRNPQKLHFYVYVENNPVNLVDPTGLGPPSECKYYKDRCECESDIYACLAYEICKRAGDNPWSNCVRNCLLDSYKGGRRTTGEIIEDHIVCISACTFYVK